MVDYGFRSSSILDLDLLGLPKNGTTSLPCPNLAFLLVLLLTGYLNLPSQNQAEQKYLNDYVPT